MTVKITVGDALAELRKMQSDSVHCVISSPPYWGLRDYGIDPSIWGGDPDCAHDFADEKTLRRVSTTAGLEELGERHRGGGKKYAGAKSFEIVRGSCLRCGAWRGALGLEPTPDMFVDHLVEVFEEVRRVLRPDGTAWLNLGDSYASATERGNGGDGTSTLTGSGSYQNEAPRPRAWARRPERGENAATGRGRTRAERDPAHAGKNTAIVGSNRAQRGDGNNGVSFGPMIQPNRLPIAGLKPKDLVGVPWMAAFALRRAGWWLRQDIVWAKPNPMPESTEDSCTKAHEYVFLLTKSARYFYDADAIAEPASENTNPRGTKTSSPKSLPDDGFVKNNSRFREQMYGLTATRNKRSVWTVVTQPFPEAHFATFPPALIEPCVMAGTSERGCCPTCQAPWERVTAKIDSGRTQKMPDGMATHAGDHGTIHKGGREKGASGNPVLETVTLGWWPTCGCDGLGDLPPYPKKPGRAEVGDEAVYQAELRIWLRACDVINQKRRQMCDAMKDTRTVPAIVLDPFGGAGTTGLVADRLQRDAVLIEMNPGYAAMARTRIDGEAPLFAARAAE
jgi:DNA modification methylase